VNELASNALKNDPDPELFKAVFDLLQTTFREIRDEAGRGYNASRAYQSLYRYGARESVGRAVLKPSAEGFGRLESAGRLDLTYEWLVLNPRWQFSPEVRSRAWERLTKLLAREGG
jgi:hypothetical protein